jgi:hypothetical protein
MKKRTKTGNRLKVTILENVEVALELGKGQRLEEFERAG